MQQYEIQTLTDIYNNYSENNRRDYRIPFNGLSVAEKNNIINALDILKEYGYITYLARSIGAYIVQITSSGIRFVENDFTEPESASVCQGNNSIYINGSKNTVSGNYNQLSAEISNSDLPDECKQLLESFLYEMGNPHLTNETRAEKIKSFLTQISSDVISGTALSGLTTLLSSLFNQIQL